MGRSVQGNQTGCHTGNGGKLRNSRFDGLTWFCLVSLYFLSDILSSRPVVQKTSHRALQKMLYGTAFYPFEPAMPTLLPSSFRHLSSLCSLRPPNKGASELRAFPFPAQSRPELKRQKAADKDTPLGPLGVWSGIEGKKSHFRFCHLDWLVLSLPLSLSSFLGTICMWYDEEEEDEVVTFSAFLCHGSTVSVKTLCGK